MEKITYRLVYNRKHRLNAQGTALIQIEAYLNRTRRYYSTHVYVKPTQWDPKRQCVRRHPNADSLNQWLHEQMASYEACELEHWRRTGEVTLDLFSIGEQSDGNQPLARYMKHLIETSDLKESTKRNRATTLAILQEWNPDITLREITQHRMVTQFQTWLVSKGYHTNTVAKHLAHLRVTLRQAVREEATDVDPFIAIRIKKAGSRHSHLKADELARLEALTLPPRCYSMRRSLDGFLFCCYTGLRYSDFTRMNRTNVDFDSPERWLTFRSLKTDTLTSVPLALMFGGKPLRLWERYGCSDDFFRLTDNSTLNKHLRRIRVLSGITTTFSFHSARHTCATLLLSDGINITTIQKLLGHRSVRTTEGYCDILQETILKDLRRGNP